MRIDCGFVYIQLSPPQNEDNDDKVVVVIANVFKV